MKTLEEQVAESENRRERGYFNALGGHYVDVIIEDENKYHDRLISYYLEGDTHDRCFGVMVCGDSWDYVEIGFSSRTEGKARKLFENLTKGRI